MLADEDEGAPLLRGPVPPGGLGFLEEAPLPGLIGLEAAWFPHTRQWVLLSGDDPMIHHIEQRRFLGFIEPVPRVPELAPVELRPYGLVPLVRAVDRGARGHRYGAGSAPAGELSLELGALHGEPLEGSVPLRLQGGRPVLDAAAPAADAKLRARWAVAPLTWRGTGPLQPRARAVARRAVTALRPPTPPGATAPAVAGYLWDGDGPNRRALYVAVHPITGDTLLTPWPLEAADLGYGPAQLLGYTSLQSSLTGSFAPREVDVPWASRFGRSVRRG